jgi:pimeloyl-ACP methyl ester carboxylesterase
MGDFADCLISFLELVGVDRTHVVGHSWGSTLALELYRRRPSIVRSLVLVGAYAGWAGSLPPDEVTQRLEFARRVADLGPRAFDPTSLPGLFSDAMSDETAKDLAAVMSEIHPAGTRTMADALAEADLREMLGQIAVPTLLIYGDADERSPLHVAHELHRSIIGSTLTVLPGLGHECYLESPAIFEEELRKFLSAHS